MEEQVAAIEEKLDESRSRRVEIIKGTETANAELQKTQEAEDKAALDEPVLPEEMATCIKHMSEVAKAVAADESTGNANSQILATLATFQLQTQQLWLRGQAAIARNNPA